MAKKDLEQILARLDALESRNETLEQENRELRGRSKERQPLGASNKRRRRQIERKTKLDFEYLKTKYPEKFGHMTFRVVNNENGGVHYRQQDGWEVVNLPSSEQDNGVYRSRNSGEMANDGAVMRMVGKGRDVEMMQGVLMMKPLEHHERDTLDDLKEREEVFHEALSSGASMSQESGERDDIQNYAPNVGNNQKGFKIEQAILREQKNG